MLMNVEIFPVLLDVCLSAKLERRWCQWLDVGLLSQVGGTDSGFQLGNQVPDFQ